MNAEESWFDQGDDEDYMYPVDRQADREHSRECGAMHVHYLRMHMAGKLCSEPRIDPPTHDRYLQPPPGA